MSLTCPLVASLNDAPPHQRQFSISAPISGRPHPISQGFGVYPYHMLGQGACITPNGYRMFAPLGGTILQIPGTAHLLRIKCENGLVLQIEVGPDAHKLMGKGFRTLVSQGDTVQQHQAILELDLPQLKRELQDIRVMVTLLNSQKLKGLYLHPHSLRAPEDTLFTLFI